MSRSENHTDCHWSSGDGTKATYQRSRNLRNVMCTRSGTESMSVGLRKSTEKGIGHLVRFMREEKFQTISLNTLGHGK